jgi:DNA-binding NtrC family response regulator
MAKLLVVDSDKNIQGMLATFLESYGHEVRTAADGAGALALLSGEPDVRLALSDFRLAETNPLDLLENVRRQHPDTLVIAMSADATVESAIAAMKAGACDYLAKPVSLQTLQRAVDRALGGLRAEDRALGDALLALPLTESRSPAMQALLRTARQAADSDATIVLLGESGVGKSILARQIHDWSPRRERPFVIVDCATISHGSELLGHARGAFTNAAKGKPGRLEAASGGTVFFDQIADLSPKLQMKLLDFLHDHRFERVGGAHKIEVDARIIAASNQDLEQQVTAGRFRKELFYRLNVISLRVPALRERPEDIPLLIERFAAAAELGTRRPGLRFAPQAMDALRRYEWPGNVRELRNAIQRAAVLRRGDVVTREDVAETLGSVRPPHPAPAGDRRSFT